MTRDASKFQAQSLHILPKKTTLHNWNTNGSISGPKQKQKSKQAPIWPGSLESGCQICTAIYCGWPTPIWSEVGQGLPGDRPTDLRPQNLGTTPTSKCFRCFPPPVWWLEVNRQTDESIDIQLITCSSSKVASHSEYGCKLIKRESKCLNPDCLEQQGSSYGSWPTGSHGMIDDIMFSSLNIHILCTVDSNFKRNFWVKNLKWRIDKASLYFIWYIQKKNAFFHSLTYTL